MSSNQQQNNSVQTKKNGFMKVGDLTPMLNKVNCIFIVLEKTTPAKTKQHIIHHFLVSDETGAIQLSLWDALGEGVHIGDIFQMKNGCCRVTLILFYFQDVVQCFGVTKGYLS
jgi:hypothetical protein